MLEFQKINKSFGHNQVLKDISLSITKGQILGLIGGNGAGKSTLMNILGGILSASSGDMVLDEIQYNPSNARAALEKGISFIHQELNLFPNLSIEENLFIDDMSQLEILYRGLISRKRMDKMALVLLKQVGLDQDPSTKAD
jgi:ribose transport system ATP-binding protein